MELNTEITLLMVEDDRNLRRIMKIIFNKLGYNNIQEASNGQEAWERIQKVEIDLVVTDLNMPVMGGIGLARLIRGASKYNHIPILMISRMRWCGGAALRFRPNELPNNLEPQRWTVLNFEPQRRGAATGPFPTDQLVKQGGGLFGVVS